MEQSVGVSLLLPDPPSHFTVDHILATELNKLSFNDRQAIEEEIHGVRCGAADENPELLERSLQEFDQQLNTRKIGNSLLRNVVYTTSAGAGVPQPQSECYLNDPNIRLRFLRSECFVVEKAVERLINFLEFSAELFGNYVAERPIKLSDFSREDMIGLNSSRNQYLPFRDRSGRRVLIGVGNCNFHLPVPLRFKILIYLHWVVSEDVETQRKGVVIVAWVFDEANDNTWEQKFRPDMKSNLHSYHKRQNAALPIRVASLQQYYRDTAFFRALSSLYVFGLNSHNRSIYKAHFGSQTELRYVLSSYGIPTDLMHISCTGTVKFGNFTAWINFLSIKLDQEESRRTPSEEIVECPRSYDVVFRKGPTYRNNPGNMFYRELIESNSQEHASCKIRSEKYQITLQIIKTIEDRSGRFLEWSKERQMWIVMQDMAKVRGKVAAALKQYKRTKKENKPKKIEKTIRTAITIIEESARADSDTECSRLRQYYGMNSHPMKRQKTSMCFGVATFDDGGSCFGREFFPTDQKWS